MRPTGLVQGVCVWEGGGLIINLLYRGGSSNYLLRGSSNTIPMETGTSTVTHLIFQ